MARFLNFIQRQLCYVHPALHGAPEGRRVVLRNNYGATALQLCTQVRKTEILTLVPYVCLC